MVPEHSPSENKKAILLLEAGTFSIGYRFGAPAKVSSEVAFSTSMISYAETTADPPCMKPYCGFSAITVDKCSTNSATIHGGGEDRNAKNRVY